MNWEAALRRQLTPFLLIETSVVIGLLGRKRTEERGAVGKVLLESSSKLTPLNKKHVFLLVEVIFNFKPCSPRCSFAHRKRK